MTYLEISLNALLGSPNLGTMRLIGFIKGVKATILLDTGNNHNFFDPFIITKAALVMQEAAMEVKIADEFMIRSERVYNRVLIKMQGHTFKVDLFALPMEGYDVVLGIHWPSTLRLIHWDFKQLNMNFTYEGQQVFLKGLKSMGQAFKRVNI